MANPVHNIEEPFMWVVLTDENQLLYVTQNSTEAYQIYDDWCATHAAEGQVIECYRNVLLQGWSPLLPPNAPLEKLVHEGNYQ